MAQSQSESSAIICNQIKIKDFCDDKKIPYLFVYVDVTKKKKGLPAGAFAGWHKKTYDELMEYNKVPNPKHNTIFINVSKSPYFVIDIDDETLVENKYKQYGKVWETISISKGLPHLWRLRDETSTYSNNIGHDDEKVDIITKWIYEKIDGYFYNTESDMAVVSSGKEIIKKSKKKVMKIVNKKDKEVEEDKKEKEECDAIIEKHKLWKAAGCKENFEILENIDIKYWDNYGDWVKLMWALYNHSSDLELCIHFAKKSEKFKDSDDIKRIVFNDKQKCLTFGTLAHYSKISNEKKYFDIRFKYTSLQNSDFQMANAYLKIKEDTIIKYQDILYIYKYPYWIEDNNKCYILNDIRKKLSYHYSKVRWTFNTQISELDDEDSDDNEADKKLLEDKIKTCTKLVSSIETSKKQESVWKQINIILQNEDYRMDLNSPNLFAFSCGTIFDTTTKSKVYGTYLKYMFISNHTGYAYMEPKQTDIDFIRNIVISIMPNPEIRKSYLSILKQTLLGKIIEKFIMFNGEGQNGKGWTLELLKEVLYNYMVNANNGILVDKITTGVNSELARFDKKRCIVFSEPDEGNRLNGATIKKFTGGGVIEARGLYQSARDIHIHATQILECNQRPAIKGRVDNALLRRIIDINFEMKFTSDKNLIETQPEKYLLAKDEYKDDPFKQKYKYAFFHVIMEGSDTLYEPDCVKQRSRDYLVGNDELLQWFNSTLKITDDKKDHTKWTDVKNIFKESEFYKNLSVLEKRNEFNDSSLIERIKANIELSKYWCDRVSNTISKGFKGVVIDCGSGMDI